MRIGVFGFVDLFGWLTFGGVHPEHFCDEHLYDEPGVDHFEEKAEEIFEEGEQARGQSKRSEELIFLHIQVLDVVVQFDVNLMYEFALLAHLG